jgi:hypothetical protein
MPICKARCLWTADHYVTMINRHNSLRFRREFKILLKLAAGLLLAFTMFVIFVAIASPYDEPAPYLSLILILVICVFALTYDRINEWHLRRNFRKYPDPKEVEWTFTLDGVQTKSSLGEATLKWEAFMKDVEFIDGFLFYYSKNVFSWIPRSAFESAECFETTREIIETSTCLHIRRQ